jgi:hypothetical protein
MTGSTFSLLLYGDVHGVCGPFSCRRTELRSIPNLSLCRTTASSCADSDLLCFHRQHPETGLGILDGLRLVWDTHNMIDEDVAPNDGLKVSIQSKNIPQGS